MNKWRKIDIFIGRIKVIHSESYFFYNGIRLYKLIYYRVIMHNLYLMEHEVVVGVAYSVI